jgi:prophage maintenance system killer protein
MIRYLVLVEVVELHRQIIEQSGGAVRLRCSRLLLALYRIRQTQHDLRGN